MGKRGKIRLIAAAALLFGWSQGVLADCQAGRIELRGAFGRTAFEVDLADDDSERSRGLMFVSEMPATQGMLFVFDETSPVSFWMKNTLIPLDMIFMDARGVVRKVHSNAIPHDETAINSDGPVQSVLEINGGLAARIGIGPGTLARHTELPQKNAAWPC